MRSFVYVEIPLAPLIGGLEASVRLLLAVRGCQVCKVHLNLIELCDIILQSKLVLSDLRISIKSGGVARVPVELLEAHLLQVAVSVVPNSFVVSKLRHAGREYWSILL